MKKITLTDSYLRECLKQARYYEFCKDSDRALTVLKPVWQNIEEPPDLAGLDRRQSWEVLLLCGSVISFYGTIHQKKHYKELAVNMLTRCRELAIEIGERDLIAEAEKSIAVAYWRHGEYENAIAFLNTVLSKYSEAEQLTNGICLLAQANLLVLYVHVDQPKIALDIYEKLIPFIETHEDTWLKTTFYNQAAGVFVLIGNYKGAIPLLEKDIEYATLTKNNCYLGNALNNLANAYIYLDETKRAMVYVEQAIELFLSINQVYPFALALETKALILSSQGDFKEALLNIDDSIKILEKGENYAELCESLWRRTDILIATGETKQAVKQFNDLLQIAGAHLSLLDADGYIEKFSKLIYLPSGVNLEEKEKNFRRHLLDQALAKCGGIVTTTAKRLGMMHQTLSAILKKFPELCEKHQVKLRTRAGSGIPLAGERATPQSSPAAVKAEAFAMRLQSNRPNHIGLYKGLIVRVQPVPLSELDLSKPIVLQDTKNKYHCGFLLDAFDMFAFENGLGEIERTFVENEILMVGKIVGIYDESQEQFVDFG